jgi:RHS repeat-associated protein
VFAYDGDNLVKETNSSGTVVARYTQTEDIDEPLAMLRSGATSYYHADGLGSVTSLSSSTGSIANTYTYDSFGNLTNSTGSLTNPFQYTARESDSETGLYYYRARYYDLITGRFISEDPVAFDGSDVNFYAYVSNSPVVFMDPMGTDGLLDRILNRIKPLPPPPPGVGGHPPKPPSALAPRICKGTARVLEGNPDTVGQRSGFDTRPRNRPPRITVPFNSVAVIPSQLGGARA